MVLAKNFKRPINIENVWKEALKLENGAER